MDSRELITLDSPGVKRIERLVRICPHDIAWTGTKGNYRIYRDHLWLDGSRIVFAGSCVGAKPGHDLGQWAAEVLSIAQDICETIPVEYLALADISE